MWNYNRFRSRIGNHDDSLKYIYNSKNLNFALTLAESGLQDKAQIYTIKCKSVKGGSAWFEKRINIKFIKVSKDYYEKMCKHQPLGLL